MSSSNSNIAEPWEDVAPSVGFTNATVTLHGHKLNIFDLGGGSRIRGIWRHYYAEVTIDHTFSTPIIHFAIDCKSIIPQLNSADLCWCTVWCLWWMSRNGDGSPKRKTRFLAPFPTRSLKTSPSSFWSTSFITLPSIQCWQANKQDTGAGDAVPLLDLRELIGVKELRLFRWASNIVRFIPQRRWGTSKE